MADDFDYILSISGMTEEGVSESADEPAAESAKMAGRRWIGMQFECCGCYSRIYRNAKGTAYLGNCPRCGRSVRVRVGPGGTSHRFFRST